MLSLNTISGAVVEIFTTGKSRITFTRLASLLNYNFKSNFNLTWPSFKMKF